MKTITRMKIENLLGRIVSCRQHIKIIRKRVPTFNEKKIVFDFTNVEFVSRSSADEFLQLQKQFKEKYHTEIEFENMGNFIKKMFNVVEKSYNINRKSSIHIDKKSKRLEEIAYNF